MTFFLDLGRSCHRYQLFFMMTKLIDFIYITYMQSNNNNYKNHNEPAQNYMNTKGRLNKPHSTSLYESFKHSSFDVTEIVKHVYISDKQFALNKLSLSKINIKKIVTAGTQLQTKFPEIIEYLKLDIVDSRKQNILAHLEDAFQFISKAVENRQNVLIHCAYGVSRSPSIVIAYLMKKFKIDYEEAEHFVKRKRPEIKPNEGFRQQLKKYSLKI